MHRRMVRVLAVGFGVAALGLSACGPSGSAQSGGARPPTTSGTLRLSGVCPDPVVVQTDWAPEAEHGGTYQLLGPRRSVDAGHKRVTGPLVAAGKDTGVKIEIRAGGPATGYQTVSAQMYQDPTITLGQISTDEAVSLSATQPTVGVVAPLDINPQMIMWDPRRHPDWKTIRDIGRTNAKVLYFKTTTSMAYLAGRGILKRSQMDGSYDGAPATYVASGGTIAQQGFATSEPYLYEKVLRQWRKPVRFQLVHDTGYPVYPEALSVRSGDKAKLAPCLRKLVPIIQRSQIDYLRHPEAVNKLIVDLDARYRVGFQYSKGQAAFSTRQLRRLHIVGDGKDRTLGDFEIDRIDRVIDIVSDISHRQHKRVKSGLRHGDIATNEFIDTSIGLSR